MHLSNPQKRAELEGHFSIIKVGQFRGEQIKKRHKSIGKLLMEYFHVHRQMKSYITKCLTKTFLVPKLYGNSWKYIENVSQNSYTELSQQIFETLT